MGDLLLGIDIGTYSSKGVLTGLDGEILASAVVEHGVDLPQSGWAQQDADKIWWQDVVSLCHQLIGGGLYTGEDIGGVGISAIGPCMLPLDKHDRPLRPGILYGVDTRATAEIDWLNAHYGEQALFDFCGMALSSQAIGPKILWMKHNEPELWAKVARITTASSYVLLRLTGEHVIDHHTASHFIPLIDNQKRSWSDRFAEPIIETSKLPRLAWSDERAGQVTPRAAQETGLKAGTPVAVGAVDALSEALSVGVHQPGDLMIMYGSTTFFILIADSPLHDLAVWSVAGAFAGQHNLAAGMATTGALTRWFKDELAGGTDYETLFNEAMAIAPGAEGLLLLPYFSGERTPINDPQARGVIAGLTLTHTRAHLFRAILEGVACGIRHNVDYLASIGADIRQIVAVGGGAKTNTWLQIVSNIGGFSQVVPARTIGASYGDAFLAGLTSGLLSRDDLSRWVRYADQIDPDLQYRSRYDALYADYLEMYHKTREIVHRLGK